MRNIFASLATIWDTIRCESGISFEEKFLQGEGISESANKDEE